MSRAPVVIAVGNRFRHDDGFGPRVLDVLCSGLLAGRARLVELDGEPGRLLDEWSGASLAVVVDAVSSGSAPAGTVHRLDLLAEEVGDTGDDASGSHGLGVATAAALGRALGRLPDRLVVFGVEGADFGVGDGLSPELVHVVGEVARRVAEEVGEVVEPEADR